MKRFAQRWWSGELGGAGTFLDAALWPAEQLFRAGVALRNTAYDRGLLRTAAARLPVVSIGNIATGGSGKTPFANWLARHLASRGERPAIIHGGYASDEPALHRAWTPESPVFVGRDRVEAARRASAEGATVAILDDAFQHRRLRRDLDIVLVSVERWSHGARMLPRGPWREPATALRRAHLVVCVRRVADSGEAERVAGALGAFTQRPVLRVLLHACRWQRDDLASEAPTGQVILVAALADPALFSANARDAGADIVSELLYNDHHDYSAADAQRIRDAARGRTIVTSAKDWVKLKSLLGGADVRVLAQDVVIEEGAPLLEAGLDRILQ